MSKFHKGKKDKKEPGISTAALPDIVFMLLFFFMVATTAKEEDPIVQISIPNADITEKLEDKSLEAIISIGIPSSELQAQYGKEPRIQLNDAIKARKDIAQFIEEKRLSIKNQAPNPDMGLTLSKKMIVSLKVDKKTTYGVIDDVKDALRDCNALKINYVVNGGADE